MTNPESDNTSKDAPEEQVECVVGIGASAGGIKAMEPLLEKLKSDVGLSIIVVQHLSPEFKSVMHEVLGRHTDLPVEVAEEGTPLRRNQIYLIPPKSNIAVEGGKLVLSEIDPDQLQRPVDVLFRSLASGFGHRCVGVILSGTGSDGVVGIRAIRDGGGLTIAQDPATAQFDGMPVNAISSNCVDLILTPENIASVLNQHSLDPTGQAGVEADMSSVEDLSGIKLVFSLLCERHGINFADYKPSTVARRIERRIYASKSESMQEYAASLQSDKTELDLLYHDLLIGVTKFFRDAEAFFAVQAQLNRIIENLPEGEELRMWSAACATGEEAYSLTMLAIESFERQDREVRLKVLATDVHQGALDTGARGVYSAESLEFVTAERRNRFFVSVANDNFKVVPELRRHIVFARHNLMQDPPFTRIHVVACRNMLIYLQPQAQAAAIGSFHFSMESNGLLFLGSSETPGRLSDEFQVIDRMWRLYRKVRTLPSPLTTNGGLMRAMATGPRRLVNILNRDKPEQLSFTSLLEAYDLLLGEFISCGLLLDENRNVLHVFGNANQFLRSNTGRFTGNIMKLLEGDARTQIGAALVRSMNEPTRKFRLHDVSFESGFSEARADITIRSLRDSAIQGCFWFIEFTSPELGRKEIVQSTNVDADSDDLATIQSELTYTKESLNATIEELETSNEELQATNEELVASNEELQSTNEELHSVNEELYSVNSENQRKINELQEISDDVENLLSSTDVATIFVDSDLCIRKFTNASTRYFHLVQHDLGRPLSNFTHNLQCDNLPEIIEQVMDSGKQHVADVTDEFGDDIILKVLPYASQGDRSGAIVNVINLKLFREDNRE